MQTYLKEAWILYGLDKTVQNEILGQSGYLSLRANTGLTGLGLHERKDIRVQILQQFDSDTVEFNTWLTRGRSRSLYPIQFKIE
jgi:hypothetical protein